MLELAAGMCGGWKPEPMAASRGLHSIFHSAELPHPSQSFLTASHRWVITPHLPVQLWLWVLEL